MQMRLGPLVLILAAATARSQDTSYVRQMAKDKTDLYFVYSGPETQRIAENLLQRVKDSSDYKEDKDKSVEVVDLAAFRHRVDANDKLLEETVVLRTEFGSGVDLQNLLGKSRDARRLRDEDGIRYVWYLSFSGLDKGTKYSSHSDRTTAPLHAPGPEPVDKSSDERGPKAQKRAHDQWVSDHKAWDQTLRNYETTPMSWLAEVKEQRHASVRVSLSIVDLEGDGRVAWEDAQGGSASDANVVSSRTVEVRGIRPIVPAPVAPNGNADCPAKLIEEAGTSGGLSVLQRFSVSAWISGDPAPGGEQVVDLPKTSVPDSVRDTTGRTARSPAKVLKVLNGQITIDVGTKDGLAVGDRVVIGIEDEPSIVFRVVSVGETAVCEPLDAKNKALAVKVRKGDKVERVVKGSR